MGKKYLFIKQVLENPSLTIEQIKRKCYIENEYILIKRLTGLLNLYIRDLAKYNILSTKKEIIKILTLLNRLAYCQQNHALILNNLFSINDNKESNYLMVRDVISSFINKLLLDGAYFYNYDNIFTKTDNSFINQDVFIIDNDNTKTCEQAYFVEKIEDKYNFYVHIVDVSFYDKVSKDYALNNNFYNMVLTFKFQIDKEGIICSQSISKNIIKKPQKIYYYNLIKELKMDNYKLYQHIEELLHLYYHKRVNIVTISNLGSTLVHELMGKIAYFSEENFLYFSKKEQKYTLIKPSYEDSAVKISAPIRNSKDCYNEKILRKWLIKNNIKKDNNKKLTKTCKYIV